MKTTGLIVLNGPYANMEFRIGEKTGSVYARDNTLVTNILKDNQGRWMVVFENGEQWVIHNAHVIAIKTP